MVDIVDKEKYVAEKVEYDTLQTTILDACSDI